MSFPEAIKIGNYTYKLEFVPLIIQSDGGARLGEIDYPKEKITIVESLSTKYRNLVIMHEIVHGLAAYRNIDLEEMGVDALADAILQLIQDNPDLMKAFMAND